MTTFGASISQKVAWLLATLVLLATGVLGLSNGVTEWPDARTGLQRSVTGGVFLYGALGIAAAIGLALRRRWSYFVTLGWSIVVTYVPGAAVIAYGGSDASIGAAVAASAASAVVAGLVSWAARVATRPRGATQHVPPAN